MKKKYLPLKYQLSLIFISYILVFFACFGLAFYMVYINNVEKNAKIQTEKLLQQSCMNLDRYMREVDKLTIAPYYNEAVMDLLEQNRSHEFWKTYISDIQVRMISLFVESISINNSEIRDIIFFTNNHMIFAGDNASVQHIWDDDICPWMSDVIAEGGLALFLPPHEAKYYLLQSPKVISMARLIREPYSNEPLGIVKVDLELSSIESILSSVPFSANNNLYLFDAKGQLFYPTDMNNEEYISENNLLKGQKGTIVFSVESKETGMKLIYTANRHDLIEEGLFMFRLVLIISILGIIVFCFASVVISNQFVKPIRTLCNNMKQFYNGNLEVRSMVNTRNEIRELEQSFNDMAARIKWLIDEVYEAKLSEKEAALYALQSQLNPHFIYNTLESVQMLAIEAGNIKIADTLADMGKLLRYTIGGYEKQTELKNELQFINAYLQVQNVRLKGMLTYVCDVDPSIELCRVPKLLLQPFIENVIKHAMGDTPVNVHVSAQIEQDELIIYIENDGQMMSRYTANKLRMQLSNFKYLDTSNEMKKTDKRMGLRLMQQQIQVLYGEHYGISLISFENITKFRIRLPYMWGDNDASVNGCGR